MADTIWSVTEEYDVKQRGEGDGLIFRSLEVDPDPTQGGTTKITLKTEFAVAPATFETEIGVQADGETLEVYREPNVEAYEGDEGLTWRDSTTVEIPEDAETLTVTARAFK